MGDLFCPTCWKLLYKLADFPVPLVARSCWASPGPSCKAAYDLGMFAYCENKHIVKIEYREGCPFCKTPPTEPIFTPTEDAGAQELLQRHLLVNLLRWQTIPAAPIPSAFAVAAPMGGAFLFWPVDDDEET